MDKKAHQAAKGLDRLHAAVPRTTKEWFEQRAAREGVTVQSIVAPILNAYARGEIQGGYTVTPDPHGNAGSRM